MNVKQTILKVWAVLLLVAMGACTQIPLSSLWALRQFDFNQLDGAQLRALAYLPNGVGTLRDALKVHVRLERGNGHADVAEETLALRPATGALASHKLTAPGPGGHWVALVLDEAEQQRLAALRDQAKAWKAADGPDAKRKLSTEVSPQFCAQTPGWRAAQVKLSLWLRWKAGQDDLPMLEGASLKDFDSKAGDEVLPACG